MMQLCRFRWTMDRGLTIKACQRPEGHAGRHDDGHAYIYPGAANSLNHWWEPEPAANIKKVENEVSDFKVGDRVRRTAACDWTYCDDEAHQAGWEGTVDGVYDDYLDVDGLTILKSTVEKVEDEVHDFKVGDRVRRTKPCARADNAGLCKYPPHQVGWEGTVTAVLEGYLFADGEPLAKHAAEKIEEEATTEDLSTSDRPSRSRALVFEGDSILLRANNVNREYTIGPAQPDGSRRLTPVVQPGLYVTSNNVGPGGYVEPSAVLITVDSTGNMSADNGVRPETIDHWVRDLGFTRVKVVVADEWDPA